MELYYKMHRDSKPTGLGSMLVLGWNGSTALAVSVKNPLNKDLTSYIILRNGGNSNSLPQLQIKLDDNTKIFEVYNAKLELDFSSIKFGNGDARPNGNALYIFNNDFFVSCKLNGQDKYFSLIDGGSESLIQNESFWIPTWSIVLQKPDGSVEKLHSVKEG